MNNPENGRGSSGKYIGLVALGAFFYSTLIIFTRQTHGMDAMSIAFFRTFFAFLFFCLFLIRFSEPLKISTYRSSIGLLVGLGIAVGLTAVLYIYAIQHTTAANASLLVNSAPVYVAFLAPWLLKEEKPKWAVISLLLLLVGVVFITNISQLEFNLASLDGILAGVVSGITYSFTFLISRAIRGRVSSMTQTLWGTGIASILLLPWALMTSWDVILSNLMALIPLGIISLGLASFLYYVALQKVRAQVVSVTAILEPVSGVIIGLLMYAEYPGILGYAGIGLILVSIYLISR